MFHFLKSLTQTYNLIAKFDQLFVLRFGSRLPHRKDRLCLLDLKGLRLESALRKPSDNAPGYCTEGRYHTCFYQVHFLTFTLSIVIQPTESKVINAPIISCKVSVSNKPLATSVPPIKVNRWRSNAMTADFIRGSLVVSGLRLRNNLIGICDGCSRFCTARPILQRCGFRQVPAKFRTG